MLAEGIIIYIISACPATWCVCLCVFRGAFIVGTTLIAVMNTDRRQCVYRWSCPRPVVMTAVHPSMTVVMTAVHPSMAVVTTAVHPSMAVVTTAVTTAKKATTTPVSLTYD